MVAIGLSAAADRQCEPHARSEWQGIITWPQEETGSPIAFTQDGKSLYVQVCGISARSSPELGLGQTTCIMPGMQLRVWSKSKWILMPCAASSS